MLNQGSQNEIRRTKVAGPTTRSRWFSAFSRCRDFPMRFGAGRGMTGGLMAAPHLGQSAVPTGTSTRQREQAGNRPTSFLLSRTAQATGEWECDGPNRIEIATRSSHHCRTPVPAYRDTPRAGIDFRGCSLWTLGNQHELAPGSIGGIPNFS